MTKWILAAVLALAASSASAQYYGTGSNPSSHPVQGYTKCVTGASIAPQQHQ
jgi:hypothetical protein